MEFQFEKEEQDLIWESLPNQIKERIIHVYSLDVEYYNTCGCELTNGMIMAVEDLFGKENLKKL